MAMYGASVEDLRLLARHFEQQSGLLTDSVLHPLDYFVHNAAWVGPNAERFRSQWSQSRAALMRASAMLHDQAERLHRQAQEQETTSGADGGGRWFDSPYRANADIALYRIPPNGEEPILVAPYSMDDNGSIVLVNDSTGSHTPISEQDVRGHGEKALGALNDGLQRSQSPKIGPGTRGFVNAANGIVQLYNALADYNQQYDSRMKELNQDPQLPLWQKSLQASINSAFQVSTKAIPSMVFSAGGAFLGGVAYGPAGAAIGAAGGSIIADALTKDYSQGVGSLAEGLVGGTINSARFFIVKGGEMVQAGVTGIHKGIEDFAQDVSREVNEFNDTLSRGAQAIINDPSRIVSTPGEMFKTAASKMWADTEAPRKAASDYADNVVAGTKEAIRNPSSLVEGGVNMVKDGVSGIARGTKNAIDGAGRGFTNFSIGVMDRASSFFNSLGPIPFFKG